MNSKNFAFTTALITVIYSVGCFVFFKQPFWGFTALIFGILATIHPIYFERQKSDSISEAQIAQYLRENLPVKQGNIVYRMKIDVINQILKLMEIGIVDLCYEEFAQIMHSRMAQVIGSGNSVKFVSTHTIDSAASIEIWGHDPSAYPWLRAYVIQQQNILKAGGTVSRVFLFEKSWLKSHLHEAKQIIATHDKYFSEFKEKSQTFAYLIRPIGEDSKDAFSIIDDKEVFVWKRSTIPEIKAFEGGKYITNSYQVKEYIEKWSRLVQDSYPPKKLFEMVESSSI